VGVPRWAMLYGTVNINFAAIIDKMELLNEIINMLASVFVSCTKGQQQT
jgi:hypothetical protein